MSLRITGVRGCAKSFTAGMREEPDKVNIKSRKKMHIQVVCKMRVEKAIQRRNFVVNSDMVRVLSSRKPRGVGFGLCNTVSCRRLQGGRMFQP